MKVQLPYYIQHIFAVKFSPKWRINFKVYVEHFKNIKFCMIWNHFSIHKWIKQFIWNLENIRSPNSTEFKNGFTQYIKINEIIFWIYSIINLFRVKFNKANTFFSRLLHKVMNPSDISLQKKLTFSAGSNTSQWNSIFFVRFDCDQRSFGTN